MVQVQVRGNIELVEHADHLLTTVALPAERKRRVGGEAMQRLTLDVTEYLRETRSGAASDSLGQGFLSEHLQSDAGHVD